VSSIWCCSANHNIARALYMEPIYMQLWTHEYSLLPHPTRLRSFWRRVDICCHIRSTYTMSLNFKLRGDFFGLYERKKATDERKGRNRATQNKCVCERVLSLVRTLRRWRLDKCCSRWERTAPPGSGKTCTDGCCTSHRKCWTTRGRRNRACTTRDVVKIIK